MLVSNIAARTAPTYVLRSNSCRVVTPHDCKRRFWPSRVPVVYIALTQFSGLDRGTQSISRGTQSIRTRRLALMPRVALKRKNAYRKLDSPHAHWHGPSALRQRRPLKVNRWRRTVERRLVSAAVQQPERTLHKRDGQPLARATVEPLAEGGEGQVVRPRGRWRPPGLG